MCGIVGFWSPRPLSGGTPADIVSRMATVLAHRGPDDAGAWTDDERGLAFGHRRLSVIDLSPAGHQPMASASGRYVIVFNGEIYNHRELRQMLGQAGVAPAWRGRSDTETLLAAIAAWGLQSALEHVVGMFAFAVWDREQQVLHLARDRLGEKPLYYGWLGNAFVFASELKAFRQFPGFERKVDRDALALYMQFGNVPAPFSIFEGVSKLEPADHLTLDAGDLARRMARTRKYWSFPDITRRGLANPFADNEETLSALEGQLRTAVRSQMEADVPLGSFLSGGVDSSLIAALMQAEARGRVKTFTIGFEETQFDESPFARAVANHLGTDHHEVRLSGRDALAAIPSIPVVYDEPFADSSQIATQLVCRTARNHVTVALSGDGGDELFGGYNRYFWSRRVWNIWARVPPPARHALVHALRRIPARSLDRIGNAFGASAHVTHFGSKAQKLIQRLPHMNSMGEMHRSLLTEWPASSHVVLGAASETSPHARVAALHEDASLEHVMMQLDTMTYLPDDVLTKVDRAAMAVGLETRVPFLDHRLVEFAWRIPLEMKIRNGQGKWALRKVLDRYVPAHLIDRPKSGFAIPLGDWLRGPLRGWVDSLLAPDRIDAQGYLDAEQITTAWREHLSGRREWTERLWYALTFQAWLEEYR